MVYQQRVRVRVKIVTGCVHEPLKDQNFIPMCCVEKHRLPRCLEGGTRVLAQAPSQIEDAEATQNLHQSWYLQHQVAHIGIAALRTVLQAPSLSRDLAWRAREAS